MTSDQKREKFLIRVLFDRGIREITKAPTAGNIIKKSNNIYKRSINCFQRFRKIVYYFSLIHFKGFEPFSFV